MEEDDRDKTNQTKNFHPRVKTMHGNKSFNTVCASMKQHVKDARKKNKVNVRQRHTVKTEKSTERWLSELKREKDTDWSSVLSFIKPLFSKPLLN